MITDDDSGIITSTGLPTFFERNSDKLFRSWSIWSGSLSGFSAITTFLSEMSALVYEPRRVSAVITPRKKRRFVVDERIEGLSLRPVIVETLAAFGFMEPFPAASRSRDYLPADLCLCPRGLGGAFD